MTPPAPQPFNSQLNNHRHNSNRGGSQADLPVVEDAEEAEARDLRINQRNSSATSMVQSQIIPRTSAQRKRKPSTEWKQRRKQSWSVTQAGLDQTKHITPSKPNITTSYPQIVHTIPPHKHYPQHRLSTPSNHHQHSAITRTQLIGNLRS